MRYFIKTSDNATILVEDLNCDSEKTNEKIYNSM